MGDFAEYLKSLPPEQRAIREKSFHPTRTFVEFAQDEIEQSIPARFEKIVRRHADRLAIKMGEQSLTYTQLNRRANRIAKEILERRGDKREPVTLLFEQGVEAVCAILGALKAGKFYVPVNPSFPNARIAAILEDSESGLLLTNGHNIGLARESAEPRLDVLDVDLLDADTPSEDVCVSLSPDDLAYIIYTSGSTGHPKGVFQNHRNLLQWTLLYTNTLHICAHDRLSLMHSHNTGGGMLNTYAALLNGAALLPLDFRVGGPRLAHWLSDEEITIYPSGPLVFRQWIDTLTGDEKFPHLRLVRLTGMPISVEDVARYQNRLPGHCLLVHAFGTSEAGTIPHYFIDKDSRLTDSTVPVGYAVGDSKVFVLDENGRKVDPGIHGEIAVRSRYLVKGYWRNCALTNERFLPDPEGGQERIWLTGDQGHMAGDGCLYHLGRKDFRVKIRGYSVETSEVELALRENRAIKDAVVIAGRDSSGEPQLIAYVVPASTTPPTASALRQFLLEKLPDYMVPSVFISLETMPLTPNGKIDRKALPAPRNTRPDLDNPYIAPRTPAERALKKIWSEVLGLDEIGIHDNFFELGGHSLRAAQVISRLRQALGVDVPLQSIFAAPSLAAMAGYVERVQETAGGTAELPLERVSRDEPVPLSLAQQRLWFLDQLEPGSARYNVSLALQFRLPLDVKILEQSLNEIVTRHEALRTVFRVADGQPRQHILPALTITIPVVECGGFDDEGLSNSEFNHFVAHETQRPFDLATGPLIRASAVRTRRDQFVLLLTLHHIAFDGWSGNVVARELSALYEALSMGQPSPLPDLPFQYADFTVWQRRRLTGSIAQNLLGYWKKQLENVARLSLPTDHPRPAAESWRGARQYFSLELGATDSLKALSRQADATLFMLLLAAFQTLLHRYTGQTDIVTGTPVAGRRHPEVENLIGFFLNMLPLRTDLSGGLTFRELLPRVRRVCLEAYAHEDLPFEMLVEELKPERHINQNPLFQVTFVLQNYPKFAGKSAAVRPGELEVDPLISRFDLHFFMTEENGGLRGYFEYNTDLFDAPTIERMRGHFKTLLQGIIDDPDRPISDLPLLTEAERHRVLIEWNATQSDYPKYKCIHQLFEEQAERAPDSVAIIFENQQLSYGDLNHRANQLAHYLRRQGVRTEARVAICLERSIEMIVGLLAVLKAGGAYVPLDPEYPKERLAFMLKDAQASALLTQRSLLENLPAQNVRAVCLDEHWPEIARESKENPINGATPESLAYVMYTSGSTGKPKGVEVLHRGVVRLLFGVDYIDLNPDQTLLHLAPSSFDASTFEIWGALLHGARCVLFPNNVPSPAELGDVLQKHRVSTLWLTASLFNLVIDEAPTVLSGVRQLLTGGEPLSVPHVRRALALLRETKIINGYGPTESTTFACCYRVPDRLDETINSIPIGRPIGNTQVYILDEHLSPVPVGAHGEIYIGGDGLARGYFNRPELTAEKFIRNPFSGDSTSCLYRTGDRGRYLPDGNIEFLGRIDDQVKIRGYRIELGEIEATLGEHPMVREAVAMAREDTPGDRRLVAYIVLAQVTSQKAEELRNFLKGKLPEPMIPSALVFLESLPVTPNGKVDRKALPAPDQSRPELERAFVAPRIPLEERLARIWGEVLKLEKVGIHDNFFDLGGNSLLATQVISRIRTALDAEVPLRAMFEAPTMAELAAVISDLKQES
jgi:amino acid adenylation domain-containing protein